MATRICSACSGTGQIVRTVNAGTDPCGACHGTGQIVTFDSPKPTERKRPASNQDSGGTCLSVLLAIISVLGVAVMVSYFVTLSS